MELVARGDGILRKIFLNAGGTADVGAVIAVIAQEHEDISGVEGVTGVTVIPTPPPDTQVQTPPLPPAEGAPTVETLVAADAEVPSMSGRVKASPLARRLADEMGVALTSVQGSGPGGRVVKRDIEAAKASGDSAEESDTWTLEESEYEDVPTSQMRKTIAKRLVTSIGPVPTLYLTVDV